MGSWACSTFCAGNNFRLKCQHVRGPQLQNTLPRTRRFVKHFVAQSTPGGADGQPSPEQMQQAMAEAMKDPAARERMSQLQNMMSNPAVQQQMAAIQNMMANPTIQQRLQELREDPELKPIFEEMRTGGMGAMMKYMNDPRLMSKIGEKMGDVVPDAVDTTASIAPPPEPEINNLLDAARFGDVEAVEDFLAVGKDINMKDAEGRTPLHYSVAYNQVAVAQLLIAEGAELESVDSMNNTALHYAAGYGRVEAVRKLLDAGSSVVAHNQNGKSPLELVRASPENPVNADADIMQRLGAAAGVST